MSLKVTPNIYTIVDDRAIFETSKGTTFVIDADDVNKIDKYHWFVSQKGYIQAMHRENGKRNHIRLHRLISNCPDNMVVDHINHDLTDNRKSNLRVCTQDENMRNRKPDKKSKSGIKGVYPENGKWRAIIGVNGKSHSIGTYSNINDAIEARHKAERFYYGEYANIQEVTI